MTGSHTTKIAPTTIPAWYSENADMQLNKDNTLNDNRRVSLQVDFEENGKIYNIGYNGINQKKEIHIISICLQNQNKHCI